MKISRTIVPLLVVATLVGCAAKQANAPVTEAPAALATDAARPLSIPEATSMLGRRLLPPPMSADARRVAEENLAAARAAYFASPSDETAIIWYGRRLAYLGRYNDAIAVYTEGLKIHPNSPRLLRHRGHRFITIRRVFSAITDLRRAADLIEGQPDVIEPDGLPNARNEPRSTLHSNIYYHLGLAHYLRGEFERARSAYERGLAVSKNDDMHCATAYWLYLTLRRLDEDERAAALLETIHADMDIIENMSYHRLLRLYKGELAPSAFESAEGGDAIDDATLGYGLGCRHLLAGRIDVAEAAFRQVIEGPMWPAFGYIAAEAELARHAGTTLTK